MKLVLSPFKFLKTLFFFSLKNLIVKNFNIKVQFVGSIWQIITANFRKKEPCSSFNTYFIFIIKTSNNHETKIKYLATYTFIVNFIFTNKKFHLIISGEYIVKELEALYMLKKYRTLKRRYYEDIDVDKKFFDFDQKYATKKEWFRATLSEIWIQTTYIVRKVILSWGLKGFD